MYQTPVEFVEEGNACIGAAMAIADRWEVAWCDYLVQDVRKILHF